MRNHLLGESEKKRQQVKNYGDHDQSEQRDSHMHLKKIEKSTWKSKLRQVGVDKTNGGRPLESQKETNTENDQSIHSY